MGGKVITESNVAQAIRSIPPKHSSKVVKISDGASSTGQKYKAEKTFVNNPEIPSPSCVNLLSPINSVDSDSNDKDLCCMCNRMWPPSLSKTSIQFVKWAKCDYCGHSTRKHA